MKRTDRIKAFVELGRFLEQFTCEKNDSANHPLNEKYYQNFTLLLEQVSRENLWFTPLHVKESIHGICSFLKEDKLDKWLNKYSIADENTNKTIAVIMAGNIPMVGFHDLLSVLISGHKFIGKLSSKDNQLLDSIAQLLIEINPDFKDLIHFQQEQLKSGFDAIIATGSNNSARYFEAYFGKYPHIIRGNRNSVAVLSGKESSIELEELGKDIFLYFGLGCRNVSKLYFPEGYDIKSLLDCWKKYDYIIEHSKYANNYDYQKSLLLMNKSNHFDNGFVLLQESKAIASPIALVNYEFYDQLSNLEKELEKNADSIQCTVSNCIDNMIPIGKAQEPELWDYADNVDTMQFLTQL